MAFVVIYDACVLYPNVLRDILIRVAMAGVGRARWTEAILDETFRSPRANRPDLDPRKLSRTRALMCEAVPDCVVTGYETLIQGLVLLPDPDDRHVLAAAVRAGAQLIVTSNLKDFPDEALAAYGVEAKEPDDFLVDQYFLDEAVLRRVIADISRSWKRQGGEQEVVAALERAGLIQLAALLSP